MVFGEPGGGPVPWCLACIAKSFGLPARLADSDCPTARVLVINCTLAWATVA